MQPRRSTDWTAVIAMLLTGVFAAIHLGKLPPALPVIRAELGFGLIAGGFVLSVFSLLGMMIAVVLGGLADRLGRKWLVAAAITALALGGGLAAVAQGLPLLMISRIIEGLGVLAVGVALPAAVFAAASERDQPLVLGIWSVYTPLGMALAMFAAPAVLASIGWRGAWWTLAAFCPAIGATVLWAMNRAVPPPRVRSHPLRLAGEALKVRGFLMIGLTFLAYAFQWVTLMVWLPTFLSEGMGFDLGPAAVATATVVLVNVFGCLAGSWLLHHNVSARRQIYLATLVMGVCVVGIFLPVLTDAARVGLAGIFSFIGGLIPPSLFNMVQRVAPRPALVGAGNGILLQGSAAGQFVGAPLVAFAVASADGDWGVAVVPMLAACAVTLVAVQVLSRAAQIRPRIAEEAITGGGLGTLPPEDDV